MQTLVLRKLEWLCVSDRWILGQGMLAEIDIYFMMIKGSSRQHNNAKYAKYICT